MSRPGRRTVAVPRVESAPPRRLPLPVPFPFPPMEATRAKALPSGADWQFEPKWDGFRCLVFRSGADVVLQSKAGQPLSRYFPELVEAIRALSASAFVLDGEIIIVRDSRISFDDLLLRIHPAESRVRRLAKETPATVMAFDILYEPSLGLLTDTPLSTRRRHLEDFFGTLPAIHHLQLSPMTTDRSIATGWFKELGPLGLDGVMAKKRTAPYRSGMRDAMVKVKHLRTADCVVGGFRFAADKAGRSADARLVGSLLLGLYDADGLLHFVGFTSSFTKEERLAITQAVTPRKGGSGFTGKSPGGPSRWTMGGEPREWEKLDPVLVCEVEYDYFSQGRFRHGTKFLRWRPDKAPRQCDFDQVERALPVGGAAMRLFSVPEEGAGEAAN